MDRQDRFLGDAAVLDMEGVRGSIPLANGRRVAAGRVTIFVWTSATTAVDFSVRVTLAVVLPTVTSIGSEDFWSAMHIRCWHPPARSANSRAVACSGSQ